MKKSKDVKEHFLNGRPLVAVDGTNGFTYVGRDLGRTQDGENMQLARYIVLKTGDLVGFKQTRAAGDPVPLPYRDAVWLQYKQAEGRGLVCKSVVDVSLTSAAFHRL